MTRPLSIGLLLAGVLAGPTVAGWSQQEPVDATMVARIRDEGLNRSQVGGMFKGDWHRKSTLAEFGFRLPSCTDNRPLKFEEWDVMRPQSIFVSATPGPWELEQTGGAFTEQVIRPTGLVDPDVVVRPVEHQVDDLLNECRLAREKGLRVLVTYSRASTGRRASTAPMIRRNRSRLGPIDAS